MNAKCLLLIVLLSAGGCSAVITHDERPEDAHTAEAVEPNTLSERRNRLIRKMRDERNKRLRRCRRRIPQKRSKK